MVGHNDFYDSSHNDIDSKGNSNCIDNDNININDYDGSNQTLFSIKVQSNTTTNSSIHRPVSTSSLSSVSSSTPPPPAPSESNRKNSYNHYGDNDSDEHNANLDSLSQQHMLKCRILEMVRATQYGNFDQCRHMIEVQHFDVNQRDSEDVTLLHWAAINNRLELVKYFITKGAVVDAIGGDLRSTPLHWATRQGLLQMVVLLMQHRADPSLLDGDGCNCLHLSAQLGHTSIVAYLIAKGVDINSSDMNGMTALMWCALRKNS